MDIELESKLKLELNSSDPGIHTRLSSYLNPIKQENANNRVFVINTYKEFLNDCLDILRRILFQGKSTEIYLAYHLCLEYYMEVASSKEVKRLIYSILETIAMGLNSINEEVLRESPLLLTIMTQSNHQLSKGKHSEDQSSLQTTKLYLTYTTYALYIVSSKVSSLTSKWIQELETSEEEAKVDCTDMLSTIVDMCHVLSRLILKSLRIIPEKIEKQISWMVENACIAFNISNKSNLKYQESVEVIKDIISSEWCNTEEIRLFITWMNGRAKFFLETDKSEQAINILSMRSEAFWLFLKFHPSHLSQCELVEMSSDTYEKCGSLLKLHNEISHSSMRNKLIDILDAWSTEKDHIQSLPTPVHIVKTWVECQLIKNDCFHFHTLHDLLSPSITKSERKTQILLEQECKSYMEISSKVSVASQEMKRNITRVFMRYINATPESNCQIAQRHLEKGKTTISCQIDDALIQCLKDSITIMENVCRSEHLSSKVNLITDQLFVAYCLHDLCYSKVNSQLETTFQSGGKTLSERILILVYNIFDILQLKGFMYHSDVVYKLIIKVYGLMNLPLDKQLCLLWNSGRLSHPLCASPINLAFIQNLSNESNELDKFGSYIDRFGKEFLQHFSFLLSNLHLSSNPKSEVTSKDPICSHSTIHVGYIYQTLAKGKLIEALSHAKEAQERQYSKLTKFTHGEEQEKRRGTHFSINTWEIIKFVAKDVVSFDSPPSDLDTINISPWKVLEGYLESTLQIGRITEMMGDGAEAVAHLELGKEISSSLDLHVFVVAFSSLLGKLYGQQQKISQAEIELKTAMELLKSEDILGCSKCKLLLYASVIEHIGELTKIEPTACKWIKLPLTSRNYFEMALEKLNDLTWRNSLSNPDEDASMKFVKCSCLRACKDEQERTSKKARVEEKDVILDQIGCSSYATCLKECSLSNMGCWQCLPSKVAKSGLLDELINLKWEFIRRKMSMKLLSRSGKFFAKSNKTNEVHGILLRRISILVVKNPFCYTLSSILQEHFHNLVAKETQDDIFSFERAELLLDISLYLMKSNDSDKSIFSNQNSIKPEEIVSWLLLAFILSRDVPIVLQEVIFFILFSDNFC